MARSYARIMTAIWRNREFRALRSSPQRTYLLLVTQPDITAVGLLPLTVRRWADMAVDTTTADLERDLRLLESGRFIAVDRDTEELLVRSFVKWDGGYNNRNRRPVIEAAAQEVTSESLFRMLGLEFGRLGLPVPAWHGPTDAPVDGPPDGPSGGGVDDMSGDVLQTEQSGLFAHVEGLSDGASGGASTSDRVVVTKVGSSHNPQPTTNNPPPVDGAQQIVAAWIERCRKRPPGTVIGQIAKGVKSMLEEGVDPDDVRAGLLEWARKGNLHPATLPSVVNEVMNRPVAAFANQTDANIASLLGATSTVGPGLYALPGGETA